MHLHDLSYSRPNFDLLLGDTKKTHAVGNKQPGKLITRLISRPNSNRMPLPTAGLHGCWQSGFFVYFGLLYDSVGRVADVEPDENANQKIESVLSAE